MPTTPYLPQPPAQMGTNLSPTDYNWQLIVQGLAPLFEVDTSKGSYSESVPAAGVNPANPATGQSAQGKEIIYVKTSADSNTYTLKGVQGGTLTLTKFLDVIRIKSDGTNWWPSLSASGGSTPIFSGNGAYFYGPGIIDPASILSLLGGAVGAGIAGGTIAANVVAVYLFELLAEWTISKVTTACVDSYGGVTATFGIYTQAGANVLDGGQFSCLAASGVQTNSIAPVTLPPGLYWHAQATTSTNDPHFPGVIVGAGAQTPSIMAFFAQNAVRAATAANALAAGVLPSTLGALTPFVPSNSNSDGIVCPLYE